MASGPNLIFHSNLNMPKKDLHTLVIEKLVPGGLGLGRLEEGIVVLVRYVLPGEKVLVQETSRKKDYISARLKKILSPSPERIEPPCPVYGRCGGCDLQHAGPDTQLNLKKSILADSMLRATGRFFSAPVFDIESPLKASEQFGYRQRIRLQVDGEGNYGFFRPESHILQPVSQCLLAKDQLNKVLQQLHLSDSFQKLAIHCGAFELLFNPAENDTVMLLHFQRKPRPADCALAADLVNNTSGLYTILMQVEGYGMYDPLVQKFQVTAPILSHSISLDTVPDELSISWEAGGFCQVNIGQNNSLVNLVLNMVTSGSHKKVLDLYCGNGNFSLAVAKLGSEILGIDAQNSAIRSAQRNAMLNKIHNCRFEKEQVPVAVNSLLAEENVFETIILDPPRQGALEISSQLPGLGAEQIIYISCNPATLARDLAVLIPAGYQLSRLVPVDMFPQTHHLESVALLKRTNM
jgi:23S rRNA (uracil1939-C5)-methyltransferase